MDIKKKKKKKILNLSTSACVYYLLHLWVFSMDYCIISFYTRKEWEKEKKSKVELWPLQLISFWKWPQSQRRCHFKIKITLHTSTGLLLLLDFSFHFISFQFCFFLLLLLSLAFIYHFLLKSLRSVCALNLLFSWKIMIFLLKMFYYLKWNVLFRFVSFRFSIQSL